MRTDQKRWRGRLALALLAALAGPADATTLIRAGLEVLARDNEAVVLGEVKQAVSYWNEDGSFILTDVRLVPVATFKGRAEEEITVTLQGGTVGGRTALIVGGPELVPGRSYLLFLNREDLPGSAGALTVRDLCQGVFEIRGQQGQLKALSQASRHPLLPDRSGAVEPPGGRDGIALDALITHLRATLDRLADRPEVRR